MKLRPATIARSALAAATALAFGAASAHAHPGHGLHEASPLHILSSPDHLGMLALSGAVLLFTGRFVQRRLPRRVLQGAGFSALATATVLWGLHV